MGGKGETGKGGAEDFVSSISLGGFVGRGGEESDKACVCHELRRAFRRVTAGRRLRIAAYAGFLSSF